MYLMFSLSFTLHVVGFFLKKKKELAYQGFEVGGARMQNVQIYGI